MNKNQFLQIIWFKRNLRVSDNEFFSLLDSNIPTIWVYLFEEEIINQEDFSYFHLKFITESLLDLRENLKKLNINLIVEKTFFEDFINKLEFEWFKILKIVWTQETWNMASYKRDLRVKKYLKEKNINLLEVANNWIVRWLKNRNEWTKIWNLRMEKEFFEPKVFINNNFFKDRILKTNEILNYYKNKTKHLKTQTWWETTANKILKTFLDIRCLNYSYNIWKPYESTYNCSRLSPYISYWNISIKTIFKSCIDKINFLKNNKDENSINKIKQINFFLSRIHWQSHFVQKLESDPFIEFKNLIPDFDNIRTKVDKKIIDDFFNWNTWIPYIDACIICLKNTWWINFRSRACIVSYICNTMMQPWQSISKRLACLFTDYEPWIHYSQLQMQSWTTWINTIRIYNPIKQSKEKDPDWKFIRKWIPKLKDIPNEYIHEPWLYHNKIPWYDKKIEIDKLNKIARDILWEIKSNSNKNKIEEVLKKHWSRKKVIKKSKEKIKKTNQLELFIK